jgi:hypothetical protein
MFPSTLAPMFDGSLKITILFIFVPFLLEAVEDRKITFKQIKTSLVKFPLLPSNQI